MIWLGIVKREEEPRITYSITKHGKEIKENIYRIKQQGIDYGYRIPEACLSHKEECTCSISRGALPGKEMSHEEEQNYCPSCNREHGSAV